MKLFLRKGQLPILIVNLIYLLIALFVFSGRKNYEFIFYIGVIVFFFALILLTNKKVVYPNIVLWGLTLWGIMHMSGGGLILANGSRLYDLILIPLAGVIPLTDTLPIFRYDQLVHIIGFGVATLVMWVLLKPLLQNHNPKKWTALSIIIVMAGFGVGALNEMVEFIATLLVPDTGVGGFINTSLDLVADLIGAIFALILIRIKKGRL